ncbi:NAD(P)-dependent dehydrogenase, short-chain alcohol dehydrogenase family [Rhodospirillales bacterium URHD0017]|nr:NAD(P)-dependent dehydrogenase, short-chain alcohol dehydrogenase family [Rhodospirillales bacterium URHD0017]
MSEATAIVTGASGGIGAAIAKAMLDRGHRVVSLALDKPDWSHPCLEARTVDLLDAKATAEVAAEIAGQHDVTHIVHNAGVIRPNPVEATPASDIAALAQLHLGTALILLDASLPKMKQRRFGRVVLISSRAALGATGRTAYSATKAGIIGMGRTWALELAPFGITVNMVAPGPIQGTQMFHEIVPAGSEREAALAAAIPMRRLGQPEDVANAVLFFAGPEASFVTGQVLYVCGGASVGTLVI